MLIEINANILIDEIMGIYEDYETYRRQHKQKYPNGQYIYDDTQLNDMRNYIGYEKAEHTINHINWIFKKIDLDNIVRAARKWYKKTDWQFCLSDKTAEKLIKFYTKEKEWWN